MQQPAVSETTEVVRPVENIIKPTLDLQPALEFIEKNASNPAPGTRIKKVNGNWVITTTDTTPTRQHAIQTTLAGDASRIYTLWKDLADTQKPPQLTAYIGPATNDQGETFSVCIDGEKKLTNPRTTTAYFNSILTYSVSTPPPES